MSEIRWIIAVEAGSILRNHPNTCFTREEIEEIVHESKGSKNEFKLEFFGTQVCAALYFDENESWEEQTKVSEELILKYSISSRNVANENS